MTAQVFVVGTGRSGTRTLAALLSSASGCRVVHEQDPPLLAEVCDHLAGRLSRRQMTDVLRRTRSVETIGGERLSGEANQRLSFVLPALAEAFPTARLVWLIRDGRTTVASMHHRKWYHPRETVERPGAVRSWAIHRLRGDEVGDLSGDGLGASRPVRSLLLVLGLHQPADRAGSGPPRLHAAPRRPPGTAAGPGGERIRLQLGGRSRR
jgi:hypothetical protein